MVVSTLSPVGPRREHLIIRCVHRRPPLSIARFLQTDFSYKSARYYFCWFTVRRRNERTKRRTLFFAHHDDRSFPPPPRVTRLVHCRRGHADFGVPRSAPLGRTAASVSQPPRTRPDDTMPPKKVVEEEKLGPWALGRFSSNLKVRSSERSARALERAQTLEAFGDSFRPIAPSPLAASPSPPRRLPPAGGTDPRRGENALDSIPPLRLARARTPPPPARLRPRTHSSPPPFPASSTRAT